MFDLKRESPAEAGTSLDHQIPFRIGADILPASTRQRKRPSMYEVARALRDVPHGLSARAQLAVVHLAALHRPEVGGAYPAVSTLGRWLGVGERQARRVLRELEDAHVVVALAPLPLEHELVASGRCREGMTPYAVTDPSRWRSAAPRQAGGAQMSRSRGGANVPQGSSSSPQGAFVDAAFERSEKGERSELGSSVPSTVARPCVSDARARAHAHEESHNPRAVDDVKRSEHKLPEPAKFGVDNRVSRETTSDLPPDSTSSWMKWVVIMGEQPSLVAALAAKAAANAKAALASSDRDAENRLAANPPLAWRVAAVMQIVAKVADALVERGVALDRHAVQRAASFVQTQFHVPLAVLREGVENARGNPSPRREEWTRKLGTENELAELAESQRREDERKNAQVVAREAAEATRRREDSERVQMARAEVQRVVDTDDFHAFSAMSKAWNPFLMVALGVNPSSAAVRDAFDRWRTTGIPADPWAKPQVRVTYVRPSIEVAS